MKIGFIGLGVMGFPVAGHLAKQGHEVIVYNRTAAKAQRWLEHYPGTSADTPAQAAVNADIIFTCVGNDDDLRSVILGEHGTLVSMKPHSLLVDHTTASAHVAREIATFAQEKNIGFIDAPVSGGQQGAENGRLTVMCGGRENDFNKAKPIISCYAHNVTLMGDVGAGQLTKMVNQITICGLIQSLAEGLHFAERVGLDQQKVIDVISKGAAQSWQMDS